LQTRQLLSDLTLSTAGVSEMFLRYFNRAFEVARTLRFWHAAALAGFRALHKRKVRLKEKQMIRIKYVILFWDLLMGEIADTFPIIFIPARYPDISFILRLSCVAQSQLAVYVIRKGTTWALSLLKLFA
jgi:hypothetical protein